MLDPQLDDSFESLLALIYEGPLEAEPWQGFLEELQCVMSAAASTLILQSPSASSEGVMLNAGGNMQAIRSYNESLFALDPFVDLPDNTVLSLREYIGAEALIDSDFYALSLKPSGFQDILGADLRVPDEFEVRLRVSRSEGARPFAEADKNLISRLLPHLERSIKIHARMNRLETERSLYAGAVAQMSVATLLIDEQGAVINRNDKAESLLASSTEIMIESGVLRLKDPVLDLRLQTMLSRLLDTSVHEQAKLVQAMRLPAANQEGDWGMILRPIPSNRWSEGKQVPTVAVFIANPNEQSNTSIRVITELFGFTKTEARFALLLANGLNLDEAAEQLHVSRNTVRTHLRSLFAKTGVSRQTLLVRLILKSVATLAP